MAITNGYATLAQFKAVLSVNSYDAQDDALIEDLITRASRTIDGITGKWFYANTQTRYFPVPNGRELALDAGLLSVTTLTNGDGTTIASTEYTLLPRNRPSKFVVKLNDRSATYWQPATTTSDDYPISIAGSWGYVNRSASDPESARVVYNTETACLQIAAQQYKERKGQAGGQVQVTAAGVVITPYGAVPKLAYDLISPYISRL